MFDGVINDIGRTNIAIIAGSILLAFLLLFLAWRSRRQKKIATRAAEAAGRFRARVLAEIKGLYPTPRYVDEELFEKFASSIPEVQSAAAEFRPFVPSKSRTIFDNALKEYCMHCKKITWTDCVASDVSPVKGKPESMEAKEIFRQKVNALLSVTKLNK